MGEIKPDADSPQGSSQRPNMDAEQIETQKARRLLELAGAYVRGALRFPGEVAALRAIVGQLLFEQHALQHQIDQLTERIERLERK